MGCVAAAPGIEEDTALFEESMGGMELLKKVRINNGLCEKILNLKKKKRYSKHFGSFNADAFF